MYKNKLQELCQRRSWNLPEYTTVKDGPDHIPRFKATAVVNGQNFETQTECKSSKDAQNSVAKMAYDYFNISTASRVHVDSSVIPPLVPVPEMHQLAQIHVPVSPPPSSLPLPPPGLLAPNSAITKPVHKDMLPSNFGVTTQTSTIHGTPIGSSGTLHIYKNRLQQYAQKKDLILPVYTSESEGPPHARHFKSRVSFDGKSYETMEFFPTLKEAEHAAAKVACQMLQIDQIQEDGGLYKNLLQELAQKRGLLCPTYKTVKSGPPHRPIFLSFVEIGSSTFRGDEARSKKQAEMNAATVAYCALTESSLVTECSKASSRMECGVSDNLTQSTLPIGTMKKDEFVANEEYLPTGTMKKDEFVANEGYLPTGTMKKDEFVANEETDISAKRVVCSPENETTNLPVLLPPDVSFAQVEHQHVTDPVAGQHEGQRSFCYKTVVFPRKSNFPIPDGASLMSCSNDQWVAYKVELSKEQST